MEEGRIGAARLVSALAMEQSEEWLTGHRYLIDARKRTGRGTYRGSYVTTCCLTKLVR